MRDAPPRWLRPAVDYGPLVAFFVVYLAYDILAATLAVMVATAVALGLSLAIERRVPLMAVITAVVIGVFGGLTLWLEDDTFIKMKPTIVQALFALILLGGLAFNKALLAPLLGKTWPMDDEGYRKLTFRFAMFFAAMAALNEVVWRTQTTEVWVYFKVFGILGITFAFALMQAPLMLRHHLEPADETTEPQAKPSDLGKE